MNRKSKLILAALGTLLDSDGYALPQASLKAHVQMRERPPATEDELKAALDYLTAQGLADTMPGELGDPDPRWFITEKGKVTLRQH